MPDFFRWLLHASKSGKPRPPDEFIWSPAKHFLFRKCRRAWFFRHYLAQGGWNTLAADPAMHAYLLKYLDTADSWMSSVAEDSLSGALLDIARFSGEGRAQALTEAFQIRVSTHLIHARDDLKENAYLDDPKFTSFQELYYNTGEYGSAQEMLQVIQNRFRDFFLQWEEIHLPQELAAVDPLDWRLPPEYRLFNYAGQQISLRPWIYAVSRRTGSAWTVRFVFSSPEDYAAFQADDEEYGLPERVFAVWCQYKYPDFELEVHKIYVTPKGLICHTEVPAPASKDLIVCSAGDMLAVVNQPDGLRSDNFPRLEDPAYCASCRFRELCESEPVPPVPEEETEEPTKTNTD